MNLKYLTPIFFILFFTSSIYAAKTKIIVKNAYNNSVVGNCKIIIRNVANNSKTEATTNKRGKYKFKYKEPIEITAIPKGDKYFGMMKTIDHLQEGRTIEIYIYPERNHYEAKLDSLGCNIEHESLDKLIERRINVNFDDLDEDEAIFPGGNSQMKSYLMGNIYYPEEAINNDVSGKVFIEFIVHEDGSINCVYAKNSVSKYLDAEAIRVINFMPNWKPGKVSGKSVSTRCMIPIKFAFE